MILLELLIMMEGKAIVIGELIVVKDITNISSSNYFNIIVHILVILKQPQFLINTFP